MLSHSAMLMMLQLPSRAELNRAIWSGGLVLQAALVFVIFGRGVARRFPGFAALITLYPVRAALLFALAGRIEADDYDTMAHVLGMLELVLQAWVVVEIALRLAQAAGGWTWRRGMAALVLVALAVSLTTVTFHMLPAEQPADRMQIVAGFLMIGLCAVALKAAASKNLLPIPAGFAAFAVFQLASLAGCASAKAHQSTGAYLAWSYLPACGYLAVVVFWLAALRLKASPAEARPVEASLVELG
jgi:peptidoglycan/LPS O-acetylase OafA/YrhL